MTDIAGSSPPPTVAPAGKSAFQRLAGVLFAPAETFQDIARKPDIVVPLLVIIVFGYIATVFIMPRIDWDSVAAQQIDAMKKQRPGMSQQDLEQASRMASAVGKAIGWIGPLMGLVWLVIIAAVLLLAFRITGGEGTFKQTLAATLYAWVPQVIAGIILTIVIVARGTAVDPTLMATIVKSNPAFLVDMKEQPILFALLSSLDIFMIWTIALLIIGFAALSKSSKAKSAAIVISLWVLTILIKLGFAALGAARMSS